MKISPDQAARPPAQTKPFDTKPEVTIKPATPEAKSDTKPEAKKENCENSNACDFSQVDLDSLHREDIDEYVADSLKKEAICFGKTSSQPRTSKLWSTFIGRNLIALPMADLVAAKDGDHLAMSVFGASHINFIAQDAAALFRRYRDIRNHDYVEAPLPALKTNFTQVKENPKTFPAYASERAGRLQENYGLTAEAFATALPILLFTGFLTAKALVKPKFLS